MPDPAAAVDFLLPDLGEDIEEADVLQVLVSVGEVVVLEQPVLEIETEKATLDLPSSVAGEITAIHVAVGDVIRAGDKIITVASGAAPPPAPAEGAAEPAPIAQPAAQADAPEPPTEEPSSPEPAPAPVVQSDGQPDGQAGDLAESPQSESEAESAAGPEIGREGEPEDAAPIPAASPPPLVEGEPELRPVFASPSVRRLAREIGVDVRAVRGSGPGGRISEDDVKRAARESPAAAAAAQPRHGPIELPDFAEFGPVERVPLSRLRRTIKRNMSLSWSEIPHVTLHHSADITDLETVRRQYRDRAEDAGGKLTVTAMLLKIAASALKAHPRVNSSLDAEADELILKGYVHIGVAVDTPRGLVVPVIRDVGEKNIIQLSVELNDISERARSGDLALDDFRGSSFTVTNLGGIGTGHFTPIIHHPNVAILGIGRGERRPVWSDERERWMPRTIMPLSFTFDHRVIDGADGARFVSWISDAIRQPLVLALEG